jgi:xanthine dehydrogenase accessory factor
VRDLRDVLAAYDALCERGEVGVLASVVRTRGSSYRRPGARMLVRPDDSLVGLVAGGCLEGDLAERARRVRSAGAPELVRHDARRPDDVLWGLGLGCAGVVEVLLERVDRACPGPLEWLRHWMEAGEPGAIATGLRGERLGWRAARLGEGRVDSSSGRVPPALVAALAAVLRSERSRTLGDYLVEYVPAPIRLAVFGAGVDAEPIVRAAVELGWQVVVSDHRPAHLKPERFPGARIVLADAESAPHAAGVDARTHAVVMTHNLLVDASLLRGLLAAQAAYVGVLGPRQRIEDLLERLRRDGFAPSAASLATLFAPTGLDVGAEAPEEIALSIVSEILAVSRARAGGFLRDRPGPIHPRFEA